MTHTRCTHPGILEVIPGSRIIQFCGNAELVAPTLRQYGELITAFSGDGPHVLRVHPALDFATIVLTVETQLTPLLLSERVVGNRVPALSRPARIVPRSPS